MRYFVAFIVFICFVAGCKSNNKGGKKEEDTTEKLKDTVYTIEGFFDALPQGSKVVLTWLGVDGKPDTANVKGGKFQFKGKMQEPLMAELYVLDANGNAGAPLQFVAENAFINIEGNKRPIDSATVIGGLQNSDFGTLKKVLKLYWDSINVLTKHGEKAQQNNTIEYAKVQMQLDTMYRETRSAMKQFVIEHPKSVAGAYYVNADLSHYLDVKELDTVYNSFDSTLMNSIYLKKIKKTIDAAKRMSIGATAPELNLNDLNEKPVLLSSYTGKYLLIDFWASWCLPCRKENPNLVRAYKKYKDRGFEILGVSLDTARGNWQTAVLKDKLTWKHVSDLKGWESTSINLYGIEAIPSNVLIDKAGKIIARNLFGENLDSTLAGLITTPSIKSH